MLPTSLISLPSLRNFMFIQQSFSHETTSVPFSILPLNAFSAEAELADICSSNNPKGRVPRALPVGELVLW